MQHHWMCIQPSRPSSLPRWPQSLSGWALCDSTITTANPFPAPWGDSPLFHSLPCTGCSIKYRGGCPVVAWSGYCPMAAAGTVLQIPSNPSRKIAALPGQTLISRIGHEASLPGWKGGNHPSSLAPQSVSPGPQRQHSIPALHSLSWWTAYSHLEKSGNGSWNVGWKKKRKKKKRKS